MMTAFRFPGVSIGHDRGTSWTRISESESALGPNSVSSPVTE